MEFAQESLSQRQQEIWKSRQGSAPNIHFSTDIQVFKPNFNLGKLNPNPEIRSSPIFPKTEKSTFDRNTRELMSNFPIESNKTQEDSGALLIDKIKP
jgi:hypothetical protein